MKKINTVISFYHDANGSSHTHCICMGAVGGGKTQTVHTIITKPKRKTKFSRSVKGVIK